MMATPQTLPTTIHHEDQTTKIINRIVGLMMVQQIYRTKRRQDEQPLTELIILISNKCSKPLGELKPIADMVFEDYPAHCYRLYYTQQAKESIKKGNLFFYDVCINKNLCYSDPAVESNLFPEVCSLEKTIEKAKQNFDKEIAKIQAFNEGADFYLQKENHALTAFMIHQQIELAYRAIEFFAMGKDKVTHSIRVHQKHVRPYLPALGSLFNEADDFENKLMQHLDDAYLKVRYGENYLINKDKLLKAKEKGAEAQQIVASIYERMIAKYENQMRMKLESEQIEDSPKLSQTSEPISVIDKIVRHITSKILVSRIYQMGHRVCSVEQQCVTGDTKQTEEHFDLVVIIDGVCDQEVVNLQGAINNSNEISASVSLWIHSCKSIEKSMLDFDNGYFFATLLKSGNLLYQKGGDLEYDFQLEYDEPRIKRVNDYTWTNRYSRARALMHAAVNLDEDDNEMVKLWLLHQAMEQICLAFIFVMIGYKPNQHSLSHLFSICRCISPSIHEVFPIENSFDRFLFNELLHSGRNIRYYSCDMYNPSDVVIIRRRCWAWMEKAEELCQTAKTSVGTRDRERGILE